MRRRANLLGRIALLAAAWCAAECADARQACAAAPFVIRGSISGVDSGRLLVLARTSAERTDTLGCTTFDNPEFVLFGEVEEPVAAYLMLEGFSGGFFFFAEPGGQYQARLNNGPDARIDGTPLMEAWYDYLAIVQSYNAEIPLLNRRADSLRAAGKYRSASEAYRRAEQMREEAGGRVEAFLAQHDGILPAYVAETRAAKIQEAGALHTLYDALGPRGRDSHSGRMLAARIADMEKIGIGQKAPDFVLEDAAGTPVRMSEVKGRLKIIDFWASWCGPCRMNNPELRSLYADYHDKGLEIIGVSLDEKKEAWEKAVAKDSLVWTNLCSGRGWKCDVVQRYNVTAVPAMFVLDAENRIVATGLRNEALRSFVSEILDTEPKN